MSEINWSEYFGRQAGAITADEVRKSPVRLPSWLSWLLSWEEWITFGIVLIVFFSVVQSIDSAKWVTHMPSLYITAGLALLTALFLARVPVFEAVLHVLALIIGTFTVVWQVRSILPGLGWRDAADQMIDRTVAWLRAAVTGDINTDTLPFVVLVVGLTWTAAYFSCWAVFRWKNVWLALIPGGFALLTNISYLPGQFSFAFVIYLFGAILLTTRLHLVRKMEQWRRNNVTYPEFLSLSTLNWAVLVALLLLVLAWTVPLANRAGLFVSIWNTLTGPIQEVIADSNRLFSAIDAKKGVGVHKFTASLPFQGSVKLSDAVVLQARTTETGTFLRAVAYDQYTHAGWRTTDRRTEPLESVGLDKALLNADEAKKQYRRPITVDIQVELMSNVLFTLGEPLTASIPTKAELGSDPADVTAVRPNSRLKRGDRYTVTGAVSTAPIDRLQQASQNYPTWVKERYLQLPPTMPPRVKALAEEWTRGRNNAFDKAQAIENNLRTFSTDYNIPVTPVDRDTVDFFLFDLRRGYFDYHASAMAVLLRSIGIPARVVIGYALDPAEYDANAGVYLVSERSSYTWVEAYFPGYGWIEFNPTPDRAPIARPASDTLDTTTADPRPSQDAPVPDELFEDIEPFDGVVVPQQDSGLSRAVVILLWMLGILALAAVLATLSFRIAWERAVAGLPVPAQVWEKTVRLAHLAKLGPHPQQTPREYARDLARKVPGVEGLDYLAESYGRSRFGGKEVTPEESRRLQQIWADLRDKLVARILHWK